MSLFDVISGALALAGGKRQATLEEDKIRSEIQYKKDAIASNKEIAASQRDLTERLAGRQQTHEKELQKDSQSFRAGEAELVRKFQSSESAFMRTHATDLAKMQIDAQTSMNTYNQGQATDRLILELGMKEKIANLQATLTKEGLAIETKKLEKLAPWEVDAILKAMEIAHKGITGTEGLATMYTKGAGGMQGNLDIMQGIMSDILNMTGIKIDLPKVAQIKPKGSTGTGVARPFDIVPPAGSNPDSWVPELDALDKKQAAGQDISQDLMRLKAAGWTDYPKAVPSPASQLPPDLQKEWGGLAAQMPPAGPTPQVPYAGQPAQGGVTNYATQSQVIDNGAPNPTPRLRSYDPNPKDELAINAVIQHALQSADPDMAASEYESILSNPETITLGNEGINPVDRLEYNKGMARKFREGFDFQRRSGGRR